MPMMTPVAASAQPAAMIGNHGSFFRNSTPVR